jgi:prophage antirepressor-like protein
MGPRRARRIRLTDELRALLIDAPEGWLVMQDATKALGVPTAKTQSTEP